MLIVPFPQLEVHVHRFICGLALGLTITAGAASAQVHLDRLTLPEGFSIEVYAADVPNARSMARSPGGTLFVSTRSRGDVYAVVDADRDHRADEVHVLATGLNMPNGVAFRDGSLYVAEVNRVLRYDGIESRLDDPPEPVVVDDEFPTDRAHGWKFIRFGPDGKLYVPVGAPCNICDETGQDVRYATITRMNADGSGQEVFAHGVRNTVGFDWHPDTGELWFTNNGRDWLGDESPRRHPAPRPPHRHALRLSLLPRGRHRRPRVRRPAELRRVHAAGAGPRAPRGVARACGSTPARCSRPSTRGRSSSPSTARGTAPTRPGTPVTASPSPPSTATRSPTTRCSPRAG